MSTIVTRAGKGSPLTNTEVDSNFTNLNNDKLESSSYTASDVLTKIKTVDGTGSGLDADLLDGNQATDFATAAQGSLADSALQDGDTVASLDINGGTVDGITSLSVSGTSSLNGAVVINESGADVDFRVESDAKTNALVVDGATGNVGLGTSSPNRLLEMYGDRNAIIRLGNNRTAESSGNILGAIEFFSNDSTGTGANVRSTIKAVVVGAGNANFLTFSTADGTTDDVERMRIDYNGNVGIGTSSPAAKLNVSGSSSNAVAIFDKGASGQAFTQLKNSAQAFSTYVDINNNSTNWLATYDTTNASLVDVYVPGASAYRAFYTVGTERMRIDSSGNVGIGTSSPSQLLEVGSEATSNNYIQVSAANNTQSGIKFRSDSSKTTGWDIGYEGNGNYLFFKNDVTGSVTERMRITSAGALELTGDSGAGQTFLNFTANSNITKAQISGAKSGSNGGTLSFSTNNSSGTLTERMRIDSSGNVFVGLSSSAGNRFAVSDDGTRSRLYVTTGGALGSYNLGTGTVTCSSGIIGFSSDERLKIADGVLSNGLQKVMQIVPQYFYWKDKDGNKDQNRPRELGFFAQNIQETCGKEVVADPHMEDVFLGIHDRGVMAVLVKAIQEQQSIIEALETRIAALESN
jgi:hypothetical protein